MTTGPAGSLPADLVRILERRVREAQRDWRTPGLSVGVVHGGALAHSVHVGSAVLDPATVGDDDRQFAMGSITKTFIALVVMRLWDAGRISLADPLSAHLTDLPDGRHGGLVLRDLLSHTSGLQREPVGRIWENLQLPDVDDLLAGLGRAEQVLDPHTDWHYSNLAYALLGRVVEVVTGRRWEDVVREQVLDPLGMTSTTTRPQRPATGYFVHPHTGVAEAEPVPDLRAVSAAGALWSSVADLARYAAFLADPDPSVISPGTLALMCRPVVLRDEAWTAGHGLGFILSRVGERVLVGHSGGMPGFVTGLKVHRQSGVGAVVSANATSGASPMALAAALVTDVLEAGLEPVEPWVPEAPDADLLELLGPWWSEGSQVVLDVREGSLWSHHPAAPDIRTRFVREGTDRFRAVEGGEQGELLEVGRDEAGGVSRLHLATYALTRRPMGFGALARDASEAPGTPG